jgi:hypothetical protein
LRLGESTREPNKIERKYMIPTKEEVLQQPWLHNLGQWRLVHGVKEKHIAEISPQQRGNLGKRAKKAYDSKSTEEWSAYVTSCGDFTRAVAEAYKKGLWDGYKGTGDAVRQLRMFLAGEEEEAQKLRHAELDKANRDQTTVIEVGDVVWLVMGGYYTVTKIVRKRYHFRETATTVPRSLLVLRSYDDIAKLAKEGKPLTKKNHDQNAGRNSEGNSGEAGQG